MYISNSAIFAAVLAALALQVSAQGQSCTAAPVDSANPPSNAVKLATMQASGFRVWNCVNGKVSNATSINANADFDGSIGQGGVQEALTGKFNYSGGVAQFQYTTADGTYEFSLENPPTFTSTPSTTDLEEARWKIDWAKSPATLNGGDTYLVRTNITGGATPSVCPSAIADTINVPYSSTYYVYACPDALVVAKSSAVALSNVLSIGVLAFVALVV